GLHFFQKVLLLRREFAGLGAHITKVIGKLAGVLLSHLIAELLQLPLSASSRSERLGVRALVGGFGGALHVFTCLLQLAAFVGHAGLVFRAIHALAQLVHISEHLLFFFLKTFQ